jgi:SSS family solute:Na+ symporter
VFWKRAGGRAAFVTMISGAAMGMICFVADFFKDSISGKTGFLPPDSLLTTAFDGFARGVLSDFMLISFGMFCICVVIQIVASLMMPEALKEEARLLVWDDWREPLRGQAHGHGMGNYRVLTVIVLITFITLYVIFR